MIRPIFDRKMTVYRRGSGGRFDTSVVSGVRCAFGGRENLSRGLGDNSGRADVISEFILLWDPAVAISEDYRVVLTDQRIAGQWQALTGQPSYGIIEGSMLSPDVNGRISHWQARVVREDV